MLLVGLTPRGVWSGEVREFVWPSVYTVPINALNHILRRLAVGDESVHYVDCGDELLGNDKVSRRSLHSYSAILHYTVDKTGVSNPL